MSRYGRPIVWGFIFSALGLVVYWPALDAYFLSDDFHFLLDIRQHGLPAVWTIFPRDFFRPVIMLSFWLDGVLWGDHAWGYHLANLVFHIGNAILLVFIAGSWMRLAGWVNERAHWLALLAGLLFLVHPSHGEAVSWISGRSDVIAVFWGLASLAAYFRFRQGNWLGWLIASWIFCGGAFLSKESSISLPLLIAVLEWQRRAFDFRSFRTWIPTAGYWVVLGAYLLLRWFMLGQWIGGYDEAEPSVFREPLWFRNLAFYTARVLLPPTHWATPAGAIRCGFLALWIGGTWGLWTACRRAQAWMQRRELSRRYETPEWFFALALLYPISLLPPLAAQLNLHLGMSLGERLIYWPSVFAVLIVVCVADAVFRRWRWAAPVLLCGLAIAYAVSLTGANRVWRDAGTISRNLVNDVRSLEPGRRLIAVNLPDTLNGAYILRTGLRAVVQFDGEPRFEEVREVAFQKLESPEDGAVVRALSPGTYQIDANRDSAYFMQRKVKSNSSPGYTIERFNRSGFVVRFDSISPCDRIVYYADGRFRLIQ